MKSFTILCWAFSFIALSLGIFGSCIGGDAYETSVSNNPTDPPPRLPAMEPNVKLFIDQAKTDCLTTGLTEIKAYISVINENGHLIDLLDLSNFQITQDSHVIAPQKIHFTPAQAFLPDPVSVAVIMDYSTSITDFPETRMAMEDAVVGFIDRMQPDDQAEIIKFNSGIKYLIPFTTDKSLLEAGATNLEGSEGGHTYLYDTLYTGIEDAAVQNGRKAVIAVTDGIERHEEGFPGDGRNKQDVIALARTNAIPLFIIGLGPDINSKDLQTMSEETSGHFYQAATGDELGDIYANISELLNQGQYLMVFESPPNGKSTGALAISVVYNGLLDIADAAFPLAICP